MLDKLAQLMTNSIGVERTNLYGTTIETINIMNGDVVEYLEDLEKIDEDTFSKEVFLDLIGEAIKKSIYKVFKERKIILDEEILHTFNIEELRMLIMSLRYLSEIKDSRDISTVFLINDILESSSGSLVYDAADDDSKVAYILNICIDALPLEKYYTVIDKVYPEFITELESDVNEVLEIIEPYEEVIISDNDDDENIVKIFTLVNVIVNRIFAYDLKFVPQSLLDINDDTLNISLFKNNSSIALKEKVNKINMGINVSSNILDYVIISIIANRDYTDLMDKVGEDIRDLVFEIISIVDKDENNVIKSTLEKIRDMG